MHAIAETEWHHSCVVIATERVILWWPGNFIGVGLFGMNLKVLVDMVTELCTHSISAMACNAMPAMLLRFASCIPVLILKNQRHNFSQTNNFSQIIKFGVASLLLYRISMLYRILFLNRKKIATTCCFLIKPLRMKVSNLTNSSFVLLFFLKPVW